jgi:SAM-dependent methyltransferase
MDCTPRTAEAVMRATEKAIRPSRRRRLLAAAVAPFLLIGILAGTVTVWKPAVKRSRWGVVATNMYQDALRRTGVRVDQIGQVEAEARSAAELPRALEAIDDTFAGYLEHAHLAPDALRGKRVLELGPGDNAGVAARFVAAGASFVSAVDKFVPFQQSSYHRELYRRLRERLDPGGQGRFDEAIDLSNGIALRPSRLEWIYGRGFEDADTYPASSFDFIVSNAVLEEIYDLDRAFDAMDRLLRPGGYLLHKIDLRDYGMFSKHGFHPLEFLTMPDAVYRRMVESSGQPNRRLVDYYRRRIASLHYDGTLYTTWVLGRPTELAPHKTTLTDGVDFTNTTTDLIARIRPRLLPRYQALPDADLMIQGIYLVARKPVAAISN